MVPDVRLWSHLGECFVCLSPLPFITPFGPVILCIARQRPCRFLLLASSICPDSAFFPTAITVPGNEVDYPCVLDLLTIRNRGWSEAQAWWDAMDGSRDCFSTLRGRFSLLLPTFSPFIPPPREICMMCGKGAFETDHSAFQVINFFSGMGFVFFLQALILAMCYTVSQDQPGLKVNFMFVTIPAQMAPYAMLLVNLLFPEGGAALMLQLQGLIAGHLFDFLTRIWPEYGGGRNLIPTPAFLSRVVHATGLVQSGVGGAAGGRRVDQTSGRGTGAWRARGPGHRLG